MARQELSAANLCHLGGGAAGMMIDVEAARVLADLDDRGSDMKTRKVVITLSLFRVSEKNGRDIGIDVDVKSTLPAYESGTTVCLMEKDGRNRVIAKFEPDTLRHDQPTIPFPEHPENT